MNTISLDRGSTYPQFLLLALIHSIAMLLSSFCWRWVCLLTTLTSFSGSTVCVKYIFPKHFYCFLLSLPHKVTVLSDIFLICITYSDLLPSTINLFTHSWVGLPGFRASKETSTENIWSVEAGSQLHCQGWMDLQADSSLLGRAAAAATSTTTATKVISGASVAEATPAFRALHSHHGTVSPALASWAALLCLPPEPTGLQIMPNRIHALNKGKLFKGKGWFF